LFPYATLFRSVVEMVTHTSESKNGPGGRGTREMAEKPVPRDPRPLRPDPSECCGSGCNPCILEVYEDELAAWEERQRRRQAAQLEAEGADRIDEAWPDFWQDAAFAWHTSTTMSNAKILQTIATELGIRPQQVAAAVALLDEGATVPFIARYRKEATGSLDDTQLRQLEERLGYLRELEERREA